MKKWSEGVLKNSEDIERKLDGLLKDPENPRLYNETGVFLYYAKDFENARHYLQKAYELCPQGIDILYNYVLLLTSQFEWQNAVGICQAYLEIDPNNPDIIRTAADLYYQMGEYGLAAEYLNQLMNIESKSG